MVTEAPPRPNSQLLLRDGIAAAQAGNKVRARFLIRQVVGAEPHNEVGWLWLANLAPEPSEAVDCLRKVLDLNPDHKHARSGLSAVLVRAGVVAAQANDHAEARRLLGEATKLDPASEQGWLWLAGVSESAQDAVRCLTRVVELNPKNERAKHGLEHYHAVLGRWSCPLCQSLSSAAAERCPTCKAVTTLENVAAFDTPTNADETAMARAVTRLAPQAVKAPGSEAAFFLGLAYLNLGQPAEAIKVFNAASQRPEADAQWKTRVRRLAEHWRSNEERGTSSGKDLAPPRTVMVVDDSPTVRKLVSVSLQPAGFRVVTVSCGEKVQAAIDEHGVPDLFVLDINMPGMDGFQLCKLLRKGSETAEVPVVFLTGKDGFFNKLRGQWAGAAEYLTKPFQPKTLTDVVAKVLESSASAR
jgi:twitching motility two-component system response regulator PilG